MSDPADQKAAPALRVGTSRTVRIAWVFGCVLVIAIALSGQPQTVGADDWTATVFPQVWLSYISANGFAPAPIGGTNRVPAPIGPVSGLTFDPRSMSVDSQPAAAVSPQWAGGVALDKGRWGVLAAVQHVQFGTRNDVIAMQALSTNVIPGQPIVREFVNTDRFDLELSLSYFVADVIRDRIDLTIGGGLKLLYANSSRRLRTLVQTENVAGMGAEAIYTVCPSDNANLAQAAIDGQGCRQRQRVFVDTHFYGITGAVALSFYPFEDERVKLPLRIIPFVGAESRNDHGVVYATDATPTAIRPKRLDGTTFAVGVTAEAGIRYTWLREKLSVYGGFRLQHLHGHETFLAWGPVINMSIEFGK